MCMCADEGTSGSSMEWMWKRAEGSGRVSNVARGHYSGSNNTLSYAGEARCVWGQLRRVQFESDLWIYKVYGG